MNRYTWIAIYKDENVIQRWNEDGSENVPDPYNVKEFHLLPTEEGSKQGLKTFSLFLTKNQKLIYRKRRHIDSDNGINFIERTESVVYVLGFEESIESAYFSSFAMLMPDGRIEWTYNFNQATVYDRSLDAYPPQIYEIWDKQWEKNND